MKLYTRRQVFALAGMLGLAACSSGGGTQTTAATDTAANGSAESTETSSQEATVTENSQYAGIHHAKITVKDYGDITVELNGTIAPITVENFATLVNEGFYDGLTFHRIMQGFMIQGGDPEGTGMGGSDTTIVDEFEQNGHFNPISHTRGTISMARSNDYNSASSQFFICDADDTFLDGAYAAFGHVTEGMDVVDKIAADAKPTDDNGTIPADAQPVIEHIVMVD